MSLGIQFIIVGLFLTIPGTMLLVLKDIPNFGNRLLRKIPFFSNLADGLSKLSSYTRETINTSEGPKEYRVGTLKTGERGFNQLLSLIGRNVELLSNNADEVKAVKQIYVEVPTVGDYPLAPRERIVILRGNKQFPITDGPTLRKWVVQIKNRWFLKFGLTMTIIGISLQIVGILLV